jgi:hypothetical protein
MKAGVAEYFFLLTFNDSIRWRVWKFYEKLQRKKNVEILPRKVIKEDLDI